MKTKKVKAINIKETDVVVIKGIEYPVTCITASPGILHIYGSGGWKISVSPATKLDVKIK